MPARAFVDSDFCALDCDDPDYLASKCPRGHLLILILSPEESFLRTEGLNAREGIC